jgi:ATP-dependent RNA helicase DBP3
MFSATWPEEVRSLAEAFMSSDPVRVTVGSEELSANHRVTQIVEVLPDSSYPLRDRKLIELLEKYHRSRTNR